MLLFFIKSAIILLAILLFYKVVLEKESFYSANRFYFLAAILAIFILPLITLPQIVKHQGLVTNYILLLSDSDNGESSSKSKQLNDEGQQSSKPSQSTKSLSFWMLSVYMFGVIVLLLNLSAQIVIIMLKAIRHQDKIIDYQGTILNYKKKIEPSSFFRFIFINPESYDYDTYEQILAHEKIHVAQKHSIDILISELVICVQWFNPLVWILKKEIEKNLEYQTDHIFLRQKPQEKESYQLNLVKVANYTKPISIVTSYNQSLIKDRIQKINNKRSHNFSYWKYAFILPLLLITQLAINQPKKIYATDSIGLIDEQNANQDKLLCRKLLTRAKAQDIPGVSELLKDFDATCLKDVTEQDYKNIELAKYMINHEGEVSIDLWNENIVIEGYQLQIIQDEFVEKFQKTTAPQEGLKIHSDCKELDIAITKGDKEKVREFLLNLEADCIIDPTTERMAFLAHKKQLLKNGAKIDLAKVKVTIPFEDLEEE